jgi:hypothetical protein
MPISESLDSLLTLVLGPGQPGGQISLHESLHGFCHRLVFCSEKQGWILSEW